MLILHNCLGPKLNVTTVIVQVQACGQLASSGFLQGMLKALAVSALPHGTSSRRDEKNPLFGEINQVDVFPKSLKCKFLAMYLGIRKKTNRGSFKPKRFDVNVRWSH